MSSRYPTSRHIRGRGHVAGPQPRCEDLRERSDVDHDAVAITGRERQHRWPVVLEFIVVVRISETTDAHNPGLRLGSLAGNRLATLVRDWLGAGRDDSLAEVCART